MRWGQLSCSQNSGIRPLIRNILLSQSYLPPWVHACLNHAGLNFQRGALYDEALWWIKFSVCRRVHASIVAFEECRRGSGGGRGGSSVGGRAGGRVKLWLITLSVTEELQRMDYSNSAQTTAATQRFQRSEGEIRREKSRKLLPHLFCLSPRRRAESPETPPRSHPAIEWQMAQTTYGKAKNIYIRIYNNLFSALGISLMLHNSRWGELLLTQDILALGSWRRAGLCSTRCTATSPWSAGSCNRRSCTSDFSHVLRGKMKWKNACK